MAKNGRNLLVEAGKRLGEDIINIKAIGEGNYGKISDTV